MVDRDQLVTRDTCTAQYGIRTATWFRCMLDAIISQIVGVVRSMDPYCRSKIDFKLEFDGFSRWDIRPFLVQMAVERKRFKKIILIHFKIGLVMGILRNISGALTGLLRCFL